MQRRKGSGTIPDLILDKGHLIILAIILFLIFFVLNASAGGLIPITEKIAAINQCKQLDLSGCWDLIKFW